MKIRVISYILIMMSFSGFAQQIPQYTQYMYNTVNINPAYAGTREAISIFALHRTQWVGLDGAPVDNSFSVNTPINESHLGLGFSFENHRVGPTTQNDFSADIAYAIPTSENYKLSFGIKASANLFNLDASKLNPEQSNDNKLQNYNKFSPNIGAGVYWYSDKAYIGLSVPYFIETQRYKDEVVINKEKMHYYLIGGYVFDLSDSVKFKPATLIKTVQGAPLQVDVSANFLFNEKFVLGAAYRWSAAVSAMAGFQINDNMYIGYAYDRETTNLANYNSGSHEIFLRYEIFPSIAKIITPRFF
ncbi:PorP/SprF family type IX secretion system membrane protein [Flavobacterium aestivum]|uniref:PorP/SprF family type IX secretion system membrane protein n=1 Tax=Flavobacterium aestivum TaxID=3003257 RepID=UPI00228585CF|nr:type IX secretion system membrane protein PorP/SprF [Flavobacterium aestivum]